MQYKVIKRFYDQNDELKTIYNLGDDFPRKGLEVSKKRLEELSTKNNALGVPLIKVIQDLKEDTPVLKDIKADNKTVKEEKETSDPTDGKKGKQKD